MCDCEFSLQLTKEDANRVSDDVHSIFFKYIPPCVKRGGCVEMVSPA